MRSLGCQADDRRHDQEGEGHIVGHEPWNQIDRADPVGQGEQREGPDVPGQARVEGQQAQEGELGPEAQPHEGAVRLTTAGANSPRQYT